MSGEYITPQGLKALQDELHRLRTKERPEVTEVVAWAASNGDRSENADYHYGKRKLREIDKRMEFISKRLDVLEVIDPEKTKSDEVLFGATVTILDENDIEHIYSIVGSDESNLDKGKISYKSPIGRALLKKQAGDFVEFKTPKGEREIEIVAVEYKLIE